MHVTLDPADAFSPLTTVTLRFAGPHALDNAKRFVEERDAMLDTFVLTTDSGSRNRQSARHTNSRGIN
jgi:hypothetical protein